MALTRYFVCTVNSKFNAVIVGDNVTYYYEGKVVPFAEVKQFIDAAIAHAMQNRRKINPPRKGSGATGSAREGVNEYYTGEVKYDPGVMPLYNGQGNNMDFWTPMSQMHM